MPFHTFEYFASNLVDPMWEVFEVLENKNHSQYSNLMDDIENIDNYDLENFVREQHIDSFLNRQENKELGRRAYYMVYKMQKEITKERIIKLLEFTKRPKPYDSEILSNITLDKNYLVATNQFDLKYNRFQYDNFVFELCPINGASNSSYWVFQAILTCLNNSGVVFNVRLDPFKVFRSDDYNPLMYKMHVHGTPLDWGKLLVLRNEDFGQWFNEQNNSFTDYVWTPMDEEIHFTSEEYPSFSYNGINTSRYFHAIFNKESGNIKHCDGAIRVYNDFEIISRRGFHVRHAEVRKVGRRIKIFQFDTHENQNKEISQDDFCQLAVNFFVWNHDVQNYFN